MLTIRSVQRADWASILEINQAGLPGVTPLGLADLSEFAEISAYFRVVEVEGAIVGYLVAIRADVAYDGEEFCWFQQQYADFLYVDQIAVSESSRRQRVASELYADLEAFAQQQQIAVLTCEVNTRPLNPKSLAFHDRQGFLAVGTLAVSDGRTVSLRAKRLAGPSPCS